MNSTLIIKVYKIFSLLVFLFGAYNIHSQWTPDAYISDFKVNDDATTQEQRYSKIGVDSAGNFVVAWNDDRNFTNNSWHQVYCQVFDKWGNRTGINFRIGQDTAFIMDLAVLQNGRFIVFWIHSYYFDRYELCFQRFDKNGNPLSIINRVIDTSFSQGAQSYSGGGIGVDSVGNFVICWSRGTTISPPRAKVFFQRFDSSGSKIGAVDTVNSTNNRALNPSIAVNMNGSYIICWQDDRLNSVISNNFDIFMQRYNSNGIKIGNNTKVNDDNDTTIIQSQPSVSSDGRGGFAVCWIDGRIFLEDNIFYQLYDSSGNAVGLNKLASSTTSGFNVSSPVCAMRSDRYFFIGWSDATGGPRKFMGRRFNSNGDPYGNPSSPYPIPVNSFAVEQCDDAFILGDRVYASWYDNRQGNFDVYCNVRGFQNPDTTVNINNIHEVIGDFILYPAYPNPFNPVTVIKYDIPKQTVVSIKIYDLLGREVVSLVNESKQPGYYEAVFDGTNYASGVYFYRIEAGSFVDVKKMVIIK